MRATTRWVALACVLLVAGCGDLPFGDAQPVGRNQISVRPLLDPDSVAVPGTDAGTVVDVLGEPEATAKRRPPKDQRPGTVKALQYEDLEVVVYELNRPSRAFVSSMTVTSGRYVTNLPVGVGSTRSDIEQILGEPVEVEGDDATYALSNDGDQCVVTYDGTRASRMVFQFD